MNDPKAVQSIVGSDAEGHIMAWVEATVRGVIDGTEVSVVCTREQGTATVSVMVPQAEVGKLIGKQGRTARALRTIIGCMAMKRGIRVHLNIEQIAAADSQASPALKDEASLPSYHRRGSAY